MEGLWKGSQENGRDGKSGCRKVREGWWGWEVVIGVGVKGVTSNVVYQ